MTNYANYFYFRASKDNLLLLTGMLNYFLIKQSKT